jgi:hypothetical protein
MTVFPQERSGLTLATFDSTLFEASDRLSLRPLRDIDAYALVGLLTTIRAAFAEGGAPVLVPPETASMSEELSSMGLDRCLGEYGLPGFGVGQVGVDASEVPIPLLSARGAGGEQRIAERLWHALRPSVSPQVLDVLGTAMFEIAGNASEHSGSDPVVMGAILAPDRGGRSETTVQVVVGDAGRGIRASFEDSSMHHPETDVDAIELALEYLVTSVSDDPGRGQGLPNTMEEVVGLRGSLVIRSGEGRLTVDPDGRERVEVPFIPGTLVALNLPVYP